MRFVLGLCLGAALVLSAAAIFDWPEAKPPAEPQLAKAPASATIIEPAQDAAAITEQEPVTGIVADPAQDPKPDPVTTIAEAVDTEVATTMPEPEQEQEPAGTLDPVVDWSLTDQPITDYPVRASEPDPEWVQEELSEAVALAEAEPEATLAAASDPDPGDEATPQVAVWRPFHSQVSAEGFAKRLSLQLGYPFSVVKTGAAQYHVVFSYDDVAQRDLLAEQLTALTGYSPN